MEVNFYLLADFQFRRIQVHSEIRFTLESKSDSMLESYDNYVDCEINLDYQ